MNYLVEQTIIILDYMINDRWKQNINFRNEKLKY